MCIRDSGNPAALVNVKKEFGDNPYELKNILKNWVRNKNQDLKVIPTAVSYTHLPGTGTSLPGNHLQRPSPIRTSG